MWSQKEELRFSKNGNAGSRITVHGATKIYVDSIDHMHAKVRVTLIKMDIEGSEMAALKGAEKIIKRDWLFVFIIILRIYSKFLF